MATVDGNVAQGSTPPGPGLSSGASLLPIDKVVADVTTATGLPAFRTETPSARAGETKSKKTSSSEEPKAAATEAPAATPNSADLAITSILPPPSAPLNANDAVASELNASVLPSKSTDLVLPKPANQEAAKTDVPAETSAEAPSEAIATAASPAMMLPATSAEGLIANASRIATQAPQDLPKAHAASDPGDAPSPAIHSRPASKAANASSQASISSATNGTQTTSLQSAAPAGAPRGTLQDGALSVAPPSSAGANRPSAGDVRGKRKETAVEGSSPERDFATAVTTPFAARLAETQAPAQAGANPLPGDDPAALQRALGGSQPLASTFSPAPMPKDLPAPAAPPAPVATPNVPVASAETAVVPGASSAQLIQSAGQTEMRLGMHSAEFGNISISTSVSHQAISAQISLDHSELGRALAAHLPAIEEKLGNAYGLHARVEVRDESAASRSAADSGQQGGASQEQTGGTRGGQNRSESAVSPVNEVNRMKVKSTTLAASSPSSVAPAEKSRLDIRV